MREVSAFPRGDNASARSAATKKLMDGLQALPRERSQGMALVAFLIFLLLLLYPSIGFFHHPRAVQFCILLLRAKPKAADRAPSGGQ